MTREELEEARQLLAECRDGLCTDRSVRVWFLEHAAELLSLAEEARWRDAETELPESDAVVQVWHVSLHASGTPVSYGVTTARFSHGRWDVYGVTHWRPLPKGPEP